MVDWMTELVNLRGRINIVENGHKICSALKSRESRMTAENEEEFYKQAYRNILSWV